MNLRLFRAAVAAVSIVALPVSVSAQGPMIPPGGILPPFGGPRSDAGITVTGHAALHLKADVAHVTLDISTEAVAETDAVQQNSIKTKAVMSALLGSGIAQKDIQTDSYTVSPDYADNTNPPLVTGYSVDNSLDVTIHDISKAGLIVDKANAAGATSTDGLSFGLAHKSNAEGEALVAAVANARSKADLVAGAAGVSVGRLLWIAESGTQPQPIMPLIRMSAMAPAAPSTPISAQDIEIDADVTATYAIDYTAP